jgi:CHASE2 domain-containing sensor protein
MQTGAPLVLIILAFAAFLLASTTWVPEPNRTRVISVGLAIASLAFFVRALMQPGP